MDDITADPPTTNKPPDEIGAT